MVHKMPEEKPVKVRAPGGALLDGTFLLWEESPDDPASVRLGLSFNGGTVFADSDEGFFDALSLIRRAIEPDGYRLVCLGASAGVFPSGMSRGMGTGDMAYRLEDGKPALTKDLVSIFDADESVVPATVEEQESYFNKWIESLR